MASKNLIGIWFPTDKNIVARATRAFMRVVVSIVDLDLFSDMYVGITMFITQKQRPFGRIDR